MCTLLVYAGVTHLDVFGEGWTIVAGTMVTVGHMAGVIAVGAHLYGVIAGYRLPHTWLWRFRSVLSLEGMLLSGLVFLLGGGIGLAGIGAYWSASSFAALPSILPIVLCCVSGAIGLQNILGGFMLAIIGGHKAAFLEPLPEDDAAIASQPLPARS